MNDNKAKAIGYVRSPSTPVESDFLIGNNLETMKIRKSKVCIYIRQSSLEQACNSRNPEQQLDRLTSVLLDSGLLAERNQESGNVTP